MPFQLSEESHRYPAQFHLFQNGFISSLLTSLSQAQTTQPAFNDLLIHIYREMFIQVLNHQWPQEDVQVPTRMTDQHRGSYLQSKIFKKQQRAVCVDIARAGMLPSQTLFEMLNRLASPEGIRQDHIYASRMTDDEGQVTHTQLSSSKIGGDIKDSFVFFPDPMGATGNSLCEVIDLYKTQVQGPARAFISLHLIVTPEFIRKMHESHPDVIVYAARVDRGMSDEDVLNSALGSRWNEEKGLNENQYIVPGAGGVGELINNSYV